MRFAPEYVANVLNENFEDAKELLLKPLMAINYAHLVMLTEQGIITNADSRTLRAALDAISLDSIRQVLYDGTYEAKFIFQETMPSGSYELYQWSGDPVNNRSVTSFGSVQALSWSAFSS